MKKTANSKIGIVVAALSICVASAEAQTRMNRVMWTDRSQTNPPLSEQTRIDGSIERFWNLPEEPRRAQSHSARPQKRLDTLSVPASRGTSVGQKREVRERRGFFGINLLNMIPLIDIVHGEVVSESLDRRIKRE